MEWSCELSLGSLLGCLLFDPPNKYSYLNYHHDTIKRHHLAQGTYQNKFGWSLTGGPPIGVGAGIDSGEHLEKRPRGSHFICI